ncbi:hypothetical protein ES705_31915 [subsurface metagenome]
MKASPGNPETNFVAAPIAVIDGDLFTPKKPAVGDFLPPYLDVVDQRSTLGTDLGSNGLDEKCGQWALYGECQNGHRFAVQLFCGKPWHEACREIMHRRKIARLLPKVQQLLPAGHWVIRPPNELQVWFLSRRGRRLLIKRVIKALKSLGYRRGLVFIHYFGDDPTRFAFHLDVLVDGGFLEPEVLEELKAKLRRLIYNPAAIKRWGDTLAVNYHYKPTWGQVYSALEYCTRPTFTQLEGNERAADSIRGERTIRRWGRWDEEPKWQLGESEKKLQSLVSLEKGECPVCGKPIIWNKNPIPFDLVRSQGGVEITTGYYSLPPTRSPPAPLGGVDQRLNGLLKRKHAAFLEREEYLAQLARGGDQCR